MGAIVSWQRYEDWPDRLARFFDVAKGKSFSRGSWDCALFACAAGQAMTGFDFGQNFRGQYDDASGADHVLKTIGAGTLQNTVIAVLGDPLPTVLKAQRGDVVLFQTEEGDALGIVDLSGQKFCAVTPKRGFTQIPLQNATLAWRV